MTVPHDSGSILHLTRRALLGGLLAVPIADRLGAPVGGRAAATLLRIDGAVNAPRSLSVSDLREMPTRDVTSVLARDGGEGAVEATWTGVPLETLLDIAGPMFGAVDVVAVGADGRSCAFGLPLEVARAALVAWAVDGSALPATRGGPLRLVVPGWPSDVATPSLAALTVTDRVIAAGGWSVADALSGRRRPVGPLAVTSRIVSPTESTRAAGWIEIAGVAWSGHGAVTGVEASADAGRTWRAAEITAAASRWGFTRFSLRCRVPSGALTLCSRATDATGMTQPTVGASANTVRRVSHTVR